MASLLLLITWPCILSLCYMFFCLPTRFILQTFFIIPIYLTTSLMTTLIGLFFKYIPFIPTPIRIYILSSIITHSFGQISFFCLEFWSNTRYVISYGTNISLSDTNLLNGILISNHSASPFDWVSVSTLCDYLNKFDRSFIFIKKAFAFVPGIGWVGALNNCKTLTRNWTKDKHMIANITQQLIANIDYKWVSPWMWLIYPEGTRMTQQKLKEAQLFAHKRGLCVYSNVLQPRVKGFSFMANKLHQDLGFIMDVTVVYKPLPPQPSHFFIKTRLSEYVHFHVTIYTKDTYDIPSDVELLNEWIRERWTEKDDIIKRMKEDKIKYKALERSPNRASMYYVLWAMIIHYICIDVIFGFAYLSVVSLLFLITSLFPVVIVFFEHYGKEINADIDVKKDF